MRCFTRIKYFHFRGNYDSKNKACKAYVSTVPELVKGVEKEYKSYYKGGNKNGED